MAYIKRIKDNELIGGTDENDVYPVTSTQAIFSQDSNGATPTGVGKILEDRLQDHEDDAKELHQKTELFAVTLTGGSSSPYEITENPNVITLTSTRKINTYGDYGSRNTTADSESISCVPSPLNYDSSIVDNHNGTYTWTLASITGTQSATYTAVKNSISRSATASVRTDLRSYFGFMSSTPVSVQDMIGDSGTVKYFGKYNTNRTTNDEVTTIHASGTGYKYIYFAVPTNHSITFVKEVGSGLEFHITRLGDISRTIDGKNYTYKLYRSEAQQTASENFDLIITF